LPWTLRYYPKAQIGQGAEPNATGRVGADGETGDFKGLTLSNSGPVFLGSRGFFFRQGVDRVSAPTRRLGNDGPGLATTYCWARRDQEDSPPRRGPGRPGLPQRIPPSAMADRTPKQKMRAFDGEVAIAAAPLYLARMLQRTLPAEFNAPCLPTRTDKLPSKRVWLVLSGRP